MVTGLVWVAPTVYVTPATLDLTAPCLTPPTLTSSRRTLKVHLHTDAHKKLSGLYVWAFDGLCLFKAFKNIILIYALYIKVMSGL